jgi:hypothetical protein
VDLSILHDPQPASCTVREKEGDNFFLKNKPAQRYVDISETNLPAELIPDLTTLEYRLPQGAEEKTKDLFYILIFDCLISARICACVFVGC